MYLVAESFNTHFISFFVMIRRKVPEDLVARLGRLEQRWLFLKTELGAVSDDEEQFYKEVQRAESALYRFHRTYENVKKQFPNSSVVRRIRKEYWDEWNFPFPSYSSRDSWAI